MNPASLAAELLAELAAHVPIDHREHASAAGIRGALLSLADPFGRDAQPMHITGSAIVVHPSHQLVLLHLHKKLDRWIQPGGHVDPGERATEAALRETAEETGLACRFFEPPTPLHLDIHDAGPHVHLDVRYLLVALGDDPRPAPPEGESQQVRWFSWSEALTVADDACQGALRAAQVRLGLDPSV